MCSVYNNDNTHNHLLTSTTLCFGVEHQESQVSENLKTTTIEADLLKRTSLDIIDNYDKDDEDNICDTGTTRQNQLSSGLCENTICHNQCVSTLDCRCQKYVSIYSEFFLMTKKQQKQIDTEINRKRKREIPEQQMTTVMGSTKMPSLTKRCITILLLTINLLSVLLLVQAANLDLQPRQTNQAQSQQTQTNNNNNNQIKLQTHVDKDTIINNNNNNNNEHNKNNIIINSNSHRATIPPSNSLILVANHNAQNNAFQQPLTSSVGPSYTPGLANGQHQNDEIQLQILPFSLYMPTNQASLLQSSPISPESILINSAAHNQATNCDSLHHQQCNNNNNQQQPAIPLLSNDDLEEALSNSQQEQSTASSGVYNNQDDSSDISVGGRYTKRPTKLNGGWNMRQLDRRGICPINGPNGSSALGGSANDNFDIDIYLFNRNYPDYSEYNYLEKYNQDIGVKELKQSRFDPTIPTYIIIHGFRGSWAGKPWQKDIKDLILAQINANVLIVDWSQGSKPAFEYDYPRAVTNSHRTGQMMASFAKKLINATQIDPKNFHLIGYSLGAHIAGYIGQAIPNVARITALDPTGVCYEEEDHERKLTRDDATTVVAIHTNGRTLGTKSNVADFDVFINGGMNQPGCSRPSTEIIKLLTFRDHSFACSHRRAHLLLAERLGFCMIVAYQCSSYEAFKSGECGYCDKNNNQCVLTNLIEQLPIHSWFSLYKQQGFTPDDSAIDSNINTKPTTADQISSQMKAKNDNDQINKYSKKQRENVRWSIDHSKQYHVLTSKTSPYCSFHYQIIIETNRRWRDETKRPVFNVELIASIDSNNEGADHMNEQITVGAQSKYQNVNVKVSHFVTNTYAIDNLSKRRQYVSINANGALSSPSIMMNQKIAADNGIVIPVVMTPPAQKSSQSSGHSTTMPLSQQQQQSSSSSSIPISNVASESGPTATAGTSYSEDIMTALLLIESSDQAFQYMPLRFSQANVSCSQQEALDSIKRVTVNYMSHSNYRIRGEYSSRLCPSLVGQGSGSQPLSATNTNPGGLNQISTGLSGGGGGGQQQSPIVMAQQPTAQQLAVDQSLSIVASNKRSAQLLSSNNNNNNNDGTSSSSLSINQQQASAGSPVASSTTSGQSLGNKSNFLSSIFNIGNKSSMKFLSVGSSSNKNKILSTRLFISDSLC